MCMSKMYMGEVAGEIAQWVKALTALPYRQGSIPSSQFEILALGDLKSLTRRIWRPGMYVV